MIAFLLIAMLSALRTSALSNGFCVRVVGEIADVEALPAPCTVRFGSALMRGEVGRVRIGHHVAFAGLELLQARRRRPA